MELIEAYRKVYRMLPPECRKQAYPVLFFMLLNGVLEVSGIASVLPFMTVASNPSVVESNIYLGRFQEWAGVSDPNSFLGLLGGIFLLLFGAVNLCTAITLWLSCRFSYGVSHHLSLSLLRQYLSRSFAWYLTRNSSDLVKDVLDEIDRLVENLVLRLVETLTSAVTSVLIFSGLILLNPTVALSTIVVIALLYNRIYRFYKTYLTTSGEERARLNTRRYRAVSQALASMKEARAFDRRSYFLEGFRGHSDTHKDVLAKHKLIGELPKYLTETLAVGAIVGVLIFLTVFRAESVESALPLVGLYIMATWRLVPAVQNLYKNAIRVKLYLPALEACAQELALPLEKAWTVSDRTEPLPLKHGISLKGVQFSYPGSEVKVIDGVDLEIQKNSSLALVGRTGEGKTTLADLISGYLVPTAGEVQVDGEPLKDERLGAWHKNIGCVPQEIYLLDDTVRRNIALGIPDGQVDQERVSEAARIAGVHDFIVNDLPKGYDTVLGERGTSLSGGQRQRVGIARALYHDPELLVLDEATSSLDNLTEKSVMDAISALADRKTMVIVAHRLSTLKACSRICLVERGRIVATGSFEELLSNSPEFKELAKDQFGLEGRAV